MEKPRSIRLVILKLLGKHRERLADFYLVNSDILQAKR